MNKEKYLNITQIQEFFYSKGLENFTKYAQHIKTKEEVEEVTQALINGNKENLGEELAGVIVTIVGQALLNDIDIVYEVDKEVDKIMKRTGKMENGSFASDHKLNK